MKPHNCKCTGYNGGQCYNCLNGAHHICDATPKCRAKKAKQIGVLIVSKSIAKNEKFTGKSPFAKIKSPSAKLKKKSPSMNLNKKARKAKVHRITEDKAPAGLARLTCVCGATASRQSWMKPADWIITRREFQSRHA